MSKQHPFIDRPNRTLIALSIPALFSLVAEPVTGLVDTAFVAQLGSIPLAALGVGTVALSSIFWVFNFLGIAAQTDVAQSLGQRDPDNARKVASLSMTLALIFGAGILLVGGSLAAQMAVLLGAEGAVLTDAESYIQVRLFAAPAVLLMLTGFGVLRGMQDMQTPFWIATAINLLNIALDAPLIYGWGAVPALGVAGSALATVISQWLGTLWVLWSVGRKLGYTRAFNWRDALDLMRVGGDLFIRTGSLTLFLLLATRVANRIDPDSGAAHQAIRQVWFFTAMVMEAYAMSAQSLVGYFLGQNNRAEARRVAFISALWSFGTGVLLALLMVGFTGLAIGAFVPQDAAQVFIPAWIAAAISQPLNGLAFVTDGIHWGTSDYRYLRNGMVAATLAGGAALLLVDVTGANALLWVWVASILWVIVRSAFGMVRIWPGVGAAPLRPNQAAGT